MAKASETEEEAVELTEEQRIELLEKALGRNRIFLLVLLILSVVSISMVATVFALGVGNSVPASLTADIESIKKQNQVLNKRLEALNEMFVQLKTHNAETRELLTKTSNVTLQQVMLEQEKSYQQFLVALQSGMINLARMVSGSRTWLEDYSDSLRQLEQESQQRQQKLKSLQQSVSTPPATIPDLPPRPSSSEEQAEGDLFFE